MQDAKQHPVLLMGLRGSGKSTLGSIVAARREMNFIDLDDQTAASLGCATAADAIDKAGLDAFRSSETAALVDVWHETSKGDTNAVIALGGGTPTAPNADWFLRQYREAGVVIYLRATPATLRARLEQTDTTTRPSLTGKGTLDEIETVFNERDELYRSLATHVIQIDGMTVEETVAAILEIVCANDSN